MRQKRLLNNKQKIELISNHSINIREGQRKGDKKKVKQIYNLN